MTSMHQPWRAILGVIVLLALASSSAFADEASAEPQPEAGVAGEEVDADQSSEALQDQVNAANNPLADLVSVSLHNYYFPKLNGLPDETANTFWLRFGSSTSSSLPTTSRLDWAPER